MVELEVEAATGLKGVKVEGPGLFSSSSSLLVLWIQRILTCIKLLPHFWSGRKEGVKFNIQHHNDHLNSWQNHQRLTWVGEDLFSRGNVDKLLFRFFLLGLGLEVVWVPLLRQLPVCLDNLLLICTPEENRNCGFIFGGLRTTAWFGTKLVGLVTCWRRGSCSNLSSGRFWAVSGLVRGLLLFPGCRQTLSPLGSPPQLKPNARMTNVK